MTIIITKIVTLIITIIITIINTISIKKKAKTNSIVDNKKIILYPSYILEIKLVEKLLEQILEYVLE